MTHYWQRSSSGILERGAFSSYSDRYQKAHSLNEFGAYVFHNSFKTQIESSEEEKMKHFPRLFVEF